MKYKIFKGDNLQSCINTMLKEGYVPANAETVYKYKKRKHLSAWVDTSTLYIQGKFRDATLKELKNLESIYTKGGRLVCLSGNDGGFDGDGINLGGLFLGVKK